MRFSSTCMAELEKEMNVNPTGSAFLQSYIFMKSSCAEEENILLLFVSEQMFIRGESSLVRMQLGEHFTFSYTQNCPFI